MESLLDNIKLIRDRIDNIKKIVTNDIDNIRLTNDHVHILGNTTLSNLYGSSLKWIPKCPILYDDLKNRTVNTAEFYPSITIKFPTKYVKNNLSKEMNGFLRQYNIEDTNLEIFMRMQVNSNLGEEADHKDGSTLTTRIRPHGWIDPNLPTNFPYHYLRRNVLVGIFDVDNNKMADEVEINKMKPFDLHLHHNLASPRGMGIKILGKKDKYRSDKCLLYFFC